MSDELFLSQADSRPMYLQIIEQIKLRILVGDWSAGHALPSIRQLAASTSVSVITVKRAYLELERLGLIVTRQGRGSFVTDSSKLKELNERLRSEELSKQIDELLELAHQLGMSGTELLESIQARMGKRR